MAAATRAAAEKEKARAARAAAMSEPSTNIKTPLSEDLYDYEAIAIVDVTLINSSKRYNYDYFSESLSNSPLTIINPTKYDRKKFRKNRKYLRDVKNTKWLYIYYRTSIQGVDDLRSLVVRNHQNRIIYNITTINTSQDETISALVDF